MGKKEVIPEGMSLETYTTDAGDLAIVIDPKEQTAWVTQSQLATLFGVDVSRISRHVRDIYSEHELEEKSTLRKTQIANSDRPVAQYNLEMVYSLGYRLNSKSAVAFRNWATTIIKGYATRGYSIDEARLANDVDMQREIVAKIRRARTSEQALYQRVRDVVKEAASDYAPKDQVTKSFFAKLQDKFHFAITGQTADQIRLDRADATKANMGMVHLPSGRVTRDDAETAKNYLDPDELHLLETLCEQFMLYAESKAMRGQKMTMEELAHKFNRMLEANDYPVLYEYPSTYLHKQSIDHIKNQLAKFNAIGAGKKVKAIKQ